MSSDAFARTGDERIELPPKVLETPIIPFDQSPLYIKVKKNVANPSHILNLYLQNYIHVTFP